MPLKIKARKSLTILGAALLLGGCKKFLEIAPPPDLATTETVFSDDQTATSAINGLYSQMMIANLYFANGGLTVMPALSSDELYRSFPDGNFDPFFNNAIPPNNFYNEVGLWKRSYQHIYQANAVLKGLSTSTAVSGATKDRLEGEAKFVRALCYFYLINLYGDVPLVTSTDYKINASVPRRSTAEVYQQIIADLLDAKALLPPEYPSTGKVRPNKFAAIALLARVYLYQQKWAEAEAESSIIIDSGVYSLSSLNDVFLANSSEAIWQLLPVLSLYNTAEGITFIPYSSTSKPNFVVTDSLLNSFELDDQRKTNWLKSNIVGGKNYYYPYKYKVRLSNTVMENNMVLRLAEQYLIRSEARAQQNKVTGSESDLNMIRNRAGLPNTLANDKASLLSAIEHERRIEFFAEFGHRWFDLKRTGRVDAVLNVQKSGWQPTDALYPIPLSELQTNPTLTQNPGY